MNASRIGDHRRSRQGGFAGEGPPVHSEIVVPSRDGDGFVTVTQDTGAVRSVHGTRLAITQGSGETTCKTATLDIPGDARVLRNGEKAELRDLQDGDQVHVSQSPQDTFVYAVGRERVRTALDRVRGLRRPSSFGAVPAPGPPPIAMARRR
jgi:hypothetical protein